MKIQFCVLLLIYLTADFNYAVSKKSEDENGECTIDNKSDCSSELKPDNGNQLHSKIYSKEYNSIVQNIENALSNYKPCSAMPDDKKCACHASVIAKDLAPFQKDGISRAQVDAAAKYGTRYKILQHKLYREEKCMFPARCGGIEHFLQPLLPQLKDMDLVINTRDWPQINAGSSVPVFSFSKTADYQDIMYPAWSFWAGGPAISLHPTGIGRWDLLRYTITRAADEVPWTEKKSIGFFRGSRTSDERDSLILLSRRLPRLVDAMYTQNQAWKSPKDTLNAVPAAEVSFEQHCRYKYLFNFRGVAASFRLKHLFLCKSLVFHVGDAWLEFFYASLKPWVHYVPLSRYPSEDELESILRFFGEHDQLAEQIAQRGYEFIWQHLRMSDVQCYWQKLLSSYQQLMRYQVNAEDDMNELLDH